MKMERTQSNHETADLRRFAQRFIELQPVFSHNNTLHQTAKLLEDLLELLMPLNDVALARWYPHAPASGAYECEQLHAHNLFPALLDELRLSFASELPLSDEALNAKIAQLDPEAAERSIYTAVPVGYEGSLIGIALFGSSRTESGFCVPERQILQAAVAAVGSAWKGQSWFWAQQLYRLVFNRTMDCMNANLLVTEVHTGKILFMNKSMKELFGLEHPEGKICWQVLQQKMQNAPCPFCPRHRLLEEGGPETVVWEEHNTLNGRIYENHDTLIRWIDGSTAHLQQSIDVTDSRRLTREANIDELTGLLNRRAGKQALTDALDHAQREGATMTVGLYDINLLKEVNDTYGHAEGDRMIKLIIGAVGARLTGQSCSFRLSGDEFVLLLYDTCKADASALISEAEDELAQTQRTLHLPYLLEFCCGLLELKPRHGNTPAQVLHMADELMYEQKRRLHLLRNERTLCEQPPAVPAAPFDFDKDLLYDALAASTDDYLFVCNMKTQTFRYSHSMVEEFGLPGAVITNAAAFWGSKIHPEDRQGFLESNQEIADGRAESHSIEYRAKNVRGEWVWLRCRGHLMRDQSGDPALFAGIVANLGKRNQTDHMTGLLNKFGFEYDIRTLIETRPEQPFGILVLGMDDFKHINDLYDRLFGDEVIRIISQKIQRLLPSYATVYRMDGDEFSILVRDGAPADLQRIYAAIHEEFNHRQEYDGKKYYCTLSAGGAFYPQDARTHLGLLKHAGYSLEYAKSCGKNCLAFFSKEILTHREKSLELIELFRESIENGFAGFELYYQPQVTASDGEVVGAEALARWSCEKYGSVSPADFIPLLEQSGLIIPVGKWIFRQAARRCREWVALSPSFVMSVNLSYLQVRERDFIPFMKQTLDELHIDPANMVVELTESYLVKESGAVRKIFGGIRELGLKIAMDDFGTGYSSLGILKSSPADIVKIDKTFIKDIKTSNFDATFIRFVVELCHDVSIRVCLEGVETEEEYRIVSPMHLDFIQGYYFGRPVSAEEFTQRYFPS